MNAVEFTRDWAASDERIASESSRTVADRIMVDDAALGVLAADSSARIGTLLIDASLSRVTVRVEDAFRTAGWRSADVRGLTRAHGSTVDFTAHAVRSARRWTARLTFLFHHRKSRRIRNWKLKQCISNFQFRPLEAALTNWNGFAGLERVARVTINAETRSEVIDHATLSEGTAQSWTRIDAALVNAGLGGSAVGIEDAFRFAALNSVAEVIRHTLTHG